METGIQNSNSCDVTRSMSKRIKTFVKDAGLFTILALVVPTADVFSDLFLIIELYSGGHKWYGTTLLVPFLLNYILAWLAWARLETNKIKTFLLPAFNLYPQYRAGRVLKLFWTEPTEGEEEKKLFERELSLTEVFVESVPTVLILTHFISTNWEHEVLYDTKLYDTTRSLWDRTKIVRFYTIFSISVFSAAFGLAKCLKVGVCRTMGEDGPAGGLLGGKFLLAMLASGAILTSKGLQLITGGPARRGPSNYSRDLSIAICLMFLPSVLLGLFSVVDFCSKNSLKILYRQPSLLLLPTFTCFTFSRVSSGCCGQADNSVMFSKKMTGINMVLTVIQTICWQIFFHYYNYSSTITTATIPLLVTGLVSTLIFLFYDKMFSCCCGWCLSPSNTEPAIYQPETRSQRAASTPRDATLDQELLAVSGHRHR